SPAFTPGETKRFALDGEWAGDTAITWSCAGNSEANNIKRPRYRAKIDSCTVIPSFVLRSLFLCRAQYRTQSLPDDNFFSGLDRHGNQLDMIRHFHFLTIRISFPHGFYQAGIVRTQYFNDWIFGTKSFRAISNRKVPGLLVPP